MCDSWNGPICFWGPLWNNADWNIASDTLTTLTITSEQSLQRADNDRIAWFFFGSYSISCLVGYRCWIHWPLSVTCMSWNVKFPTKNGVVFPSREPNYLFCNTRWDIPMVRFERLLLHHLDSWGNPSVKSLNTSFKHLICVLFCFEGASYIQHSIWFCQLTSLLQDMSYCSALW